MEKNVCIRNTSESDNSYAIKGTSKTIKSLKN